MYAVHIYVSMSTTAHMWRSEDNLKGLVLSSHHVVLKMEAKLLGFEASTLAH